MLIDAHQHFWQIARSDCRWPTSELEALYRDFGPEDLAPLMQAQGVEASVLVQSQPADTDTDYLLALADDVASVRAVVGWVDLKAPNASTRIRDIAQQTKLRGLRPMLQSLPNDDWILDRALDPAVETMKCCGLSLDALVFTRHLSYLRQFAERHPGLPIVIDHGAKPPVALAQTREWRNAMAALADLPNVYCKISGLVTEARPHPTEADLYPYVEALVSLFGATRLMWGSDWPVVNLNGDYEKWLTMARNLVGRALSADCGDSDTIDRQLQSVFADTADRFYRISL